MANRLIAAAMIGVSAAGAAAVHAQDDGSLARYFGFDETRIIVADDDFGPMTLADVNGDGLTDIVFANNRKSRIEVHLQRSEPLTQEELAREFDANEFAPSAHFSRNDVSVSHRIAAFRLHDVDGDRALDIVYAGQPAEIVVMKQMRATSEEVEFERTARRRLPGLRAGQQGFEIADVLGDDAPELAVLAGGKVQVYELGEAGALGEPVSLGSTAGMVAIFVEDVTGDGRPDLMAAIPDDPSPLRLWTRNDSGELGPELRFEMPVLSEIEPIRFEDREAASIGVIERTTRRIVLYDVVTEQSENTAGVLEMGSGSVRTRDASAPVYAFAGQPDRERGVAVADLDGDGTTDLIAADRQGNRIALHLSSQGGLSSPLLSSSFKEPKFVAVGRWEQSGPSVFVLSEEEKTVGVSRFDRSSGRLEFPQPIGLSTTGGTPVSMGVLPSQSGVPGLAVVVQDGRDHVFELHSPVGDPIVVELEGVRRSPQSIEFGDFDRDGSPDAVLLTPGEPMVMIADINAQGGSEPTVLMSDDMPQFGLVQNAGPDNTAVASIDGDEYPELIIADENFVRAASYDTQRGWRVVEQASAPQINASLSGLTVLGDNDRGQTVFAAADSANGELLVIHASGPLEVTDRYDIEGIDLSRVLSGDFGAGRGPEIICPMEEGFAMVRFGGEMLSLEQFTAYRSDEDNRFEHEMVDGDINSDGFIDLVVLDAREQMLQIFSLSAAREMILGTEFKVFESRIFSGGDRNEFEPSNAFIGDVTGDGDNDLVLQVHDRVLIYKQQTR